MGLVKEVRDFFKGRIERVLNENTDAIKKTMKMENVEQGCLYEYLQGKKVWNTFGAFKEKLKAYRELEKDVNEMANKLKNACNISSHWCSNSDLECTIMQNAKSECEKKITKDLYPEQAEKLEKIEQMREDVTGAVLLATTEAKLVEALTELLKNYGGDIDNIQKMLPNKNTP